MLRGDEEADINAKEKEKLGQDAKEKQRWKLESEEEKETD